MAEERNIILNQMIKESNVNPLLIVFTATWISQSEIVDVICDKIQTAIPNLSFISFDADKDESAFLKYNISELPTAIIIKDKTIIHKALGTFSKKDILDKINMSST